MPPISDPLRLAALRAAALLLADAAEQMPTRDLTVNLSDGFHAVRIAIEPVTYSLVFPAPPPEMHRESQDLPAPHLTPLDRHILAAAPASPVTMARLARLAEHEPDSYFQERARRLAALGLLVRDFLGYRRA